MKGRELAIKVLGRLHIMAAAGYAGPPGQPMMRCCMKDASGRVSMGDIVPLSAGVEWLNQHLEEGMKWGAYYWLERPANPEGSPR